MLIDQNQYSLPIQHVNQKYNQTDSTNSQSSNLDSHIGGSIRVLNSSAYPKQINNNYKNRTKPVKPNFKSSCIQLDKSKNYQNSVSMKNINEIPSQHEYNPNHYNNLQLALKAATAALQKSKITASTNYIPINNKHFMVQKPEKQVEKPQKSSNSPSSTSSTSSSANSSSTQALSGSATSVLFNSNQSLFQPYAKLKELKQRDNCKQTSSTPVYPKSKLYRNTLIIDTIQTEPVNNSYMSSVNTNTIQSNSTSSALSSVSSSNNKLDTSDYDNIENDSSMSKCKKISIQINPLKRHKSMSTEFLNISEKTSDDIDEDSLNNDNHLKSDFETIFNNLDKEISNFPSSSPQPPKIQPYSGVLSKSLFSLVLKPQPVKPAGENLLKVETKNKSLLKKKCVSTTNLVSDSSSKKSDMSENRVESLQTNSSKSVTTLNSKNDFDSSDNSINIDDDECDYESNNQEVDLVVEDMSEKDRRIRNLEAELRSKDDLIIELKNKLNLEMEKNKYNQRKISKESCEEEKLVYERRIDELKAHFNQQLSLFEENERFQMQNKINGLQKIYNDLKLNYKKNLDSELKTLKLKLSESESKSEHLYKQLQMYQTMRNSSHNSVASQTSSVNERDLNNNNELLFYLRKLKSENNDLKLQLESERRRFQNEKEKWFMQVHNYAKRNSMSSNENLSNSQTGLKKNNVRNPSTNMINFLNNSTHSSSSETNKIKSNPATNKQPFVKNLLINHQHYL